MINFLYFFEIITFISLRSILSTKKYEYITYFAWTLVNFYIYDKTNLWFSLNVSWYVTDIFYLITYRNLLQKWYGQTSRWQLRCLLNIAFILVMITFPNMYIQNVLHGLVLSVVLFYFTHI
jgi:hypothetical protein